MEGYGRKNARKALFSHNRSVLIKIYTYIALFHVGALLFHIQIQNIWKIIIKINRSDIMTVTVLQALVLEQGQLRSILQSGIHWPKIRWRRSLLQYSLPVESPVSAGANSLELRTLSPSLPCDNTAIHGNHSLAVQRDKVGCRAVQIQPNQCASI